MTRTPAVSVVIPACSAERYIEPAIASVFAQTFTDWELTGPTRLALSLMLPRIRLAGVKMALGKGPGLLKSTGYPPGPKDVEDLRRQLEEIGPADVPLYKVAV
ncbi:MAG: hypothetical protein ACYTFA_05120 [Planctomycetota bacterium]|jgi:hypothetical protein